MSELNDKLLDAMQTAHWMENDFKGNNTFEDSKQYFQETNIRIATNECEKICLQEMIDLLYEAISANSISLMIDKLQEQLNQLNHGR